MSDSFCSAAAHTHSSVGVKLRLKLALKKPQTAVNHFHATHVGRVHRVFSCVSLNSHDLAAS